MSNPRLKSVPKGVTAADAEKKRLDDLLDEGLRGTFPGSDPVSVIQPGHVTPDLPSRQR